jgi:hypothetical protein
MEMAKCNRVTGLEKYHFSLLLIKAIFSIGRLSLHVF